MSSAMCRKFVNTLINIYFILTLIIVSYFYGHIFLDRFDKLISQNVSIQIESDVHLKTKEESLNWLNFLTSSRVLGALFIVNQVFIVFINFFFTIFFCFY